MPRKRSESEASWKKNADLPWRKKAPQKEPFEHAKLRATNEPGQGSVMYLPQDPSDDDPRERLRQRRRMRAENSSLPIDPRLKFSFQKNFRFLRRAFSLDTLLMPLPADLSRSVARNLGFFARIFTQFFDPKGIQSAQKSIGLGQEDRIRRVR